MTDILVLILFVLSGAASGWLGVDLLPVDILKQVSNVEGFRVILAIIGLFICLLYTSDAADDLTRCRSRWSPYH